MIELSPLKTAQAYANAGYHVFPLIPGNKEPLTEHGHKDATTDTAQINAWWQRWTDANVGIACEQSGIVVLDLDRHRPEQDGIKAFEMLEGYTALPMTPQQNTGGGGRHIVLRAPLSACKTNITDGIDVKHKGYIVAEPSRLTTGGTYKWESGLSILECAPAEVPEWLFPHLVKNNAMSKDESRRKIKPIIDDSEINQMRFIEFLTSVACPAIDGKNGNDTTFRVSCEGQNLGLSKDVALSLMLKHYNPRCQPPWSEHELETIVCNSFKYAQNPQGCKNSSTSKEKKPNARDLLLDCARDAVYWHDSDGNSYATITTNEHREHYNVQSNSFKSWLDRQYYLRVARSSGVQAMKDALLTIEGWAKYEGELHNPHIRVGGYDGKIYLDLADDYWQAIEITSDGWKVISNAPVRFIRKKGMLALPEPQTGTLSDLAALRDLINLPDDNSWTLFLSALLAAYLPTGPYPVVVIVAEQGCGKSFLCRVFRSLIDPSSTPLRVAPKDENNLFIAATSGWIVALDNLSKMTPNLSDLICMLSTGAGLSKRQLFTDGDEVLFNASRLVIINGIDDLATRGDLVDRAVFLNLPTIPKDRRKTEAEINARLDAIRPAVLGAMLDAVSYAIRTRLNVKLEQLPRMADFATWATAAETKLGLTTGKFMEAYTGNRRDAIDLALEASPVAQIIRKMTLPWEGTTSDLLQALRSRWVVFDSQRFPSNAKVLSDQLRRVAPALRQSGVEIAWVKHKRQRTIRIDRPRIEKSTINDLL